MSTCYGFACAEHDQATGSIGCGPLARTSLADIWGVREHLAGMRAGTERSVLEPIRWFGLEDGRTGEAFAVEHRGCLVELVDEYGGRELPDDVAGEQTEPDADVVVRMVLTRLEFPPDAVDRTVGAIVDAMDGARLLNYNRRPARLRGGL